LAEVEVSLSHTQGMAIAQAVAVLRTTGPECVSI
jgi:phosphopantetheinyl transferase (holo-ACP synthase)